MEMKYRATIRDNITGNVVYTAEHTYTNEEELIGLWTEGNYSCDCNRHLFYTNWNEDAEDVDCGEFRYTLISLTKPEGFIFPEIIWRNDEVDKEHVLLDKFRNHSGICNSILHAKT
jgi:hypothetical protein